MSTTATIENMRRHYRGGVFAYSPDTGEEYSANPGDYFWAGEGFTLTDSEDEPMVLVTRTSALVDVGGETTTDGLALAGVRVTLYHSEVDAGTVSVQVETDDTKPCQRVRVMLNDADLYAGDPEVDTSETTMGLTLTRDQLEAWAGRPLSDADVSRLAVAVPHSSIPGAVHTIVSSFYDFGS